MADNTNEVPDENMPIFWDAASNNVALGPQTGVDAVSNATAVGAQTLTQVHSVHNVTALGYQATVTGSNQVQLGNTWANVYTSNAVQTRADRRDYADIKDTALGLEFILKLRPIDFRLDLREDYIDYSTRPVPPAPLRPEPVRPVVDPNDPNADAINLTYQADWNAWAAEAASHNTAQVQYEQAVAAWDAANQLSAIVRDGSKKRVRYHHGFNSQDVWAVAHELGVDFGGFQNHAIAGGQDIKTLGYQEFIAPLVRAVQQLNERLDSEEFVARLADRVAARLVDENNNPIIDAVAERVLAKMRATRRR